MLNKLAELANELDKRGYSELANEIDAFLKTLAADENFISLADKAACEMCGEFEKLSKEETGQGDVMMLCKQCKKDYGKK